MSGIRELLDAMSDNNHVYYMLGRRDMMIESQKELLKIQKEVLAIVNQIDELMQRQSNEIVAISTDLAKGVVKV